MENLFEKKVSLYSETDDAQIILGDSFKILTKMKFVEACILPCIDIMQTLC